MVNPLLLKVGGVAAIVVAGFGAKAIYDRYQQALGAARAEARTATAQRDTLSLRIDSLASASTAQKETLRVTVVRRVPVRDTVERWLRDTVPVPVEVVRELVRADSAVIQACTVAFNTCEQEKLALREDVRLSELQTSAYRRQIPSSTTRITASIRDGLIGAALCYFVLCPKR